MIFFRIKQFLIVIPVDGDFVLIVEVAVYFSVNAVFRF